MKKYQGFGFILGLLLLLACTACYSRKDYSPTAPGSVGDAFMLVVDPLSIPADGSSVTTVQATVRPANGQNVIFTADRGTFRGAATATPSTIKVQVNSLGVSQAFLISDHQAGQVQVTAMVDGTPSVLLRQIVTFAALDPGKVISAQVNCTALLADSVSLCPVVAKIDPAFAASQAQPVKVQFSTTAGQFQGATAADPMSVMEQVDGSYRATANLLAGQAGSALVTLSVGGVSASARLVLQPALPNLPIDVVPDQFTLTGDQWLPVSAQLSRSIGAVSQGTRILVAVRKASDGTPLSFSIRNVMPSDSTGLAKFEVSRGAASFVGRFRIIVSVDGSPAVGSVIVNAAS